MSIPYIPVIRHCHDLFWSPSSICLQVEALVVLLDDKEFELNLAKEMLKSKNTEIKCAKEPDSWWRDSRDNAFQLVVLRGYKY